MKRIIILGFLLLSNAEASIKKSRDQLAVYRSELQQIEASLNSLEKEIGSKTNLYLSSLEKIDQFDANVKIYKSGLAKKRSEVEKTKNDNKKIIQSYLLETENDGSELWQRKVHLDLLKKAQKNLHNKEAQLLSFEKKINEFEQKLSILQKNEEELAFLIDELENRKKIIKKKYIVKLKKKKKIEARVQSSLVRKSIKSIKNKLSRNPRVLSKPDRIFSRPVENYLSYKTSPKGITFKYHSSQPIKAVGPGKIVYAGDLSSYGQVVLVDHGDDLRTVLLGKMNIKVKKNDVVKDGDILAYTFNDSKEAQNLYFEVRKKNTAQNTVLWLENLGVSKI